MNVYRHIAIALLLCFSVFLGHNLIPHHHHSEALMNPVSRDCPIQHEDHGCDQDRHAEEEEHPVHCHAFNDIAFKKHENRAVKPLALFLTDMVVLHANLIPEPEPTIDFLCFNGLKRPLKTIELIGSRGLRGPPAA